MPRQHSSKNLCGKPPKYVSPAKKVVKERPIETQEAQPDDVQSVSSRSYLSACKQRLCQPSEYSETESMHSYRSYKSNHLKSSGCKRRQNKTRICKALIFQSLYIFTIDETHQSSMVSPQKQHVKRSSKKMNKKPKHNIENEGPSMRFDYPS